VEGKNDPLFLYSILKSKSQKMKKKKEKKSHGKKKSPKIPF